MGSGLTPFRKLLQALTPMKRVPISRRWWRIWFTFGLCTTDKHFLSSLLAMPTTLSQPWSENRWVRLLSINSLWLTKKKKNGWLLSKFGMIPWPYQSKLPTEATNRPLFQNGIHLMYFRNFGIKWRIMISRITGTTFLWRLIRSTMTELCIGNCSICTGLCLKKCRTP